MIYYTDGLEIETEKTRIYWIARLRKNPDIYETGTTEAEAVGALVIRLAQK